jgi:2'-5' RNA ligase
MRNNWLSFTLPEGTRQNLYDICSKLNKMFKINTMRFNNLHMTAVFMSKWYVSRDHDKLFELINKANLSGSFEFDKLVFFPPSKKNLVVAVFKISKTSGIEKNLKLLKNSIRSELGYDVDMDDFIPHVTLGKMIMTKQELNELIKQDKCPLSELTESILNGDVDKKLDFQINDENPLYLCGETRN